MTLLAGPRRRVGRRCGCPDGLEALGAGVEELPADQASPDEQRNLAYGGQSVVKVSDGRHVTPGIKESTKPEHILQVRLNSHPNSGPESFTAESARLFDIAVLYVGGPESGQQA